MKDFDLFTKREPEKPLVRTDPKMPIIVDMDRDVIEERHVLEWPRLCGAPKKILTIMRRSKNPVVAWTPDIGWCVYAVNEMTEQRAFYFREDVDDPGLSVRCMKGEEP